LRRRAAWLHREFVVAWPGAVVAAVIGADSSVQIVASSALMPSMPVYP
jgi:hypothetical protein